MVDLRRKDVKISFDINDETMVFPYDIQYEIQGKKYKWLYNIEKNEVGLYNLLFEQLGIHGICLGKAYSLMWDIVTHAYGLYYPEAIEVNPDKFYFFLSNEANKLKEKINDYKELRISDIKLEPDNYMLDIGNNQRTIEAVSIF